MNEKKILSLVAFGCFAMTPYAVAQQAVMRDGHPAVECK
jgi:hypothetical protein